MRNLESPRFASDVLLNVASASFLCNFNVYATPMCHVGFKTFLSKYDLTNNVTANMY